MIFQWNSWWGLAAWELLHWQVVRMYHLYEGVLVMQMKTTLD